MTKKSIEINIVSEEQIQHHSSAYDIQTIDIQHLIRDIRGQQIILDYDLAKLYGVETKQLNRQVKRNIERFPEDFMFQLTENEMQNLKCQFGTSSWGGSRYKPYAFTENGIAMLSGVLRSQVAIDVNIRIMRTFVAMRRFVANTSHIFKRLETLEYHQLETDKSHDRFLMIDDNIYLIGASIKDLGKKLFGFSLMQNLSVTDLLKKIEQ